jgi:hypothetical protein
MRYTSLLMLLFSANVFGSELCEPHPELGFFNKVSGVLEIELNEDAKPMKNLPGNFVSKPGSKVVKVVLNTELYNEENDSFRELSKAELNEKAFESKTIVIGSESGESVKHSAINGKYFTTKELISAVEFTELKTRGNTDWFGGVDVHHIFFEGLACHKGIWVPFWGS